MILVADAGNTDMVFGLHNGSKWIHTWRIPSSENRSKQAWHYRIVSELLEWDVKPHQIERTVMSSVVPDLTQPLAETLSSLNNRSCIVVNPKIYPQLKVKTRNPSETGTDLIANAVAAYERFQGKCLIVDFGTALTFTTIADDGWIIGVAIAPGLKTAIRSLFSNTAQLPEVPLKVPDSALGKNTIHAIQAGVALGYTGMVDFLIKQIKSEVGQDCKVVATGGLVSVLSSLHPHFDQIDQNLTLEGLLVIGEQVASASGMGG